MATVVDLRQFAMVPAQGSARAATRAWTLLDPAQAPLGFVVEQPGSAFSLLRRHLSSQQYRYETSYHVTDPGGALELVLTRRPSNLLKTRVGMDAALADGGAVARSEQAGSGGPRDVGRFEITDPVGNPLATAVRDEGLHWTITDPTGGQVGMVRWLPVTRSLVNRDGRDIERYEIEHGPQASARVRVGVLAGVLANASFYPG